MCLVSWRERTWSPSVRSSSVRVILTTLLSRSTRVCIAALMFGAPASGAQAQDDPSAPKVVIVEPTADALLVGTMTFKALVLPESVATKSVEVFLDGAAVPVCEIDQRPFECTFAVPERIARHTIRAVANLANGGRAVATVVTAAGVQVDVETNAVLVPVVVTDRRGRFVKGLARESFSVFENGVAQPVTFVAAENIPIDIVVAIDVSESMRPSLDQLKTVAKRFLSSVDDLKRSNANAKVTMLGFNDRTFVLARPDSILADQLTAMDRLSAFGGTALYDAILRSIDLLGTEISRKAIVVFTDGDDRNSLASVDPVLRRVRDSDATVYVITQGDQANSSTTRKAMGALAETSGGRAFRVGRVDQLDGVLQYIVEDLTNQYLMGYDPKNTAKDGSFRQITVKTPVKSHTIRAREGYHAPSR